MNKIYLLLFFILLMNKIIYAQSYNISVLPARLSYFDKNLNIYYFFKYGEIERKISDKYSAGLGIYYAKDKYELFAGGYRELLYKFEPSIKYYFNDKNNMSGIYIGSGISYINSSNRLKGKFASVKGDTVQSRYIYQYLQLNIITGYKLVFINNRFLLNFEICQSFNLLGKELYEIEYPEGNYIKTKNNLNQKFIANPYINLKLGYRFGYKK